MIKKIKDYLKYFVGEYSKTIGITLFIVLSIIISMLVFMQNEIYQQRVKEVTQDEEFEYYLVGVLIDKNKYLEQKDPQNYRVNLKLGILYELIKNFPESERQFRKAIAKAPYDDFTPQYKLAGLYIRENKLQEAQAMMDNISERADKRLIYYKGDIYLRLADKYYSYGEYLSAIDRYKKAAFYYNIVKKSAIPDINSSLASSYIYQAEKYLDSMKLDEAVDALKTAQTYVDAPIIHYKLAILQIANQPQEAYKNFEIVFKREPSLINYEIYHNFLTEMAVEAEASGDTADADLYNYKAKKFKDYYMDNILSINDISVETSDAWMVHSPWKNQYDINLELVLRNTSPDDIKSLFVNVDFKQGEKVIANYKAQIVDKKSVLKSGLNTPDIEIRTVYKPEYLLQQKEDIKADISVSKADNSYKISLGVIDVVPVKKNTRHKIVTH